MQRSLSPLSTVAWIINLSVLNLLVVAMPVSKPYISERIVSTAAHFLSRERESWWSYEEECADSGEEGNAQ